MRVVFVQWGTDVTCATMLVASLKRLGYEVWQLSDTSAPEVVGVDHVERKPMTTPRMVFRLECLADLTPPYVSLDTDMLVAQDIAGGFSDADVSLTWREMHTIIHKPTGRVIKMPYNAGAIWVRDQRFIRECLREVRGLEPLFQDWYGDQIALRDVAKHFRVRELRDVVWNYVPASVKDRRDDVRIYHFKGRRKPLMQEFAARMAEQ